MNDSDKDVIRRLVETAVDSHELIKLAIETKDNVAFNSELLSRINYEITQIMGDGVLYSEGMKTVERKPKWSWDRVKLEALGYDKHIHAEQQTVYGFDTRKLNTLVNKLDTEAATELKDARTATWRMEYD